MTAPTDNTLEQTPPIIELRDVRFRYANSDRDSLSIPELTVEKNERVFIQGKSGSGKTTLLNLLAGITTPSAGEVHVLCHALHDLKPAARDQFRAQHLGVIFQQFNLIPYLSVIDNVLLPQAFSRKGGAPSSCRSFAEALLQTLEIPRQAFASPANQLSVGQQQRVAVARALAGQPELLIADEPTSALDSDNKHRFIELLFTELNKQGGTLLFVSHDASLSTHFDRMLNLDVLNQA